MKAETDGQAKRQPVIIALAFKLLCLLFAFSIVAYIAWQASDVLLILFAGTLGAIVFTCMLTMEDYLERRNSAP